MNTLKPADITLVKAMKNPPEGVKLVMSAVCVMLNVPADRLTDPRTGKKVLDYWGPSKRILSDMKFLDQLRDYDKDNIDQSITQVSLKNRCKIFYSLYSCNIKNILLLDYRKSLFERQKL